MNSMQSKYTDMPSLEPLDEEIENAPDESPGRMSPTASQVVISLLEDMDKLSN
jgi:hypothetical protein